MAWPRKPTEHVDAVVVLAEMVEHRRQNGEENHVNVRQARRATLERALDMTVASLFEILHRLIQVLGHVVEQRQQRCANHLLTVLHHRAREESRRRQCTIETRSNLVDVPHVDGTNEHFQASNGYVHFIAECAEFLTE